MLADRSAVGSASWLAAILFALSACQTEESSTPAPEPVGYANPELLVEPDWLAEHLASPDLRVVDARESEAYRSGHIPGAVNVPRSATYHPDKEPGALVGSPEQIAELFGSRGIEEFDHVVVYDQGLATAAARVFWTLEHYGHPRVSVLNGGFTRWVAQEREVTTEEPEVTPVSFTVRASPDTLSTKELILEDLDDADAVMLDVRTPEEYRGEDVRSERGGHIPDAVHIEWTRNFTDDEVPVLKAALELEAMYEGAGVTRDKRVHAY